MREMFSVHSFCVFEKTRFDSTQLAFRFEYHRTSTRGEIPDATREKIGCAIAVADFELDRDIDTAFKNSFVDPEYAES